MKRFVNPVSGREVWNGPDFCLYGVCGGKMRRGRSRKEADLARDGYEDVSEYYDQDIPAGTGGTADPEIQDLVSELTEESAFGILSGMGETRFFPNEKFRAEAEKRLRRLEEAGAPRETDEALRALFALAPRRAAERPKGLSGGALLAWERDVIDRTLAAGFSGSDLLKEADVSIVPANRGERNLLERKMDGSGVTLLEAWRIKSPCSDRAFLEARKKIGMSKKVLSVWHGSRTRSWWSLIINGMKVKPAGACLTGSMFGNGCYFALDADKSRGYTDCKGSRWARGEKGHGFIGLYDIVYGNPFYPDYKGKDYSSFGFSDLKRADPEADCLHARKADGRLRKDEIVIYPTDGNRIDRAKLKYLLKVR